MAVLDFPADTSQSPYEENGITYEWDGQKWIITSGGGSGGGGGDLTLQEVTDNGNTTTNSIQINAASYPLKVTRTAGSDTEFVLGGVGTAGAQAVFGVFNNGDVAIGDGSQNLGNTASRNIVLHGSSGAAEFGGTTSVYDNGSTTGKGVVAFDVGNGAGNKRFSVYPDGSLAIGGTGVHTDAFILLNGPDGNATFNGVVSASSNNIRLTENSGGGELIVRQDTTNLNAISVVSGGSSPTTNAVINLKSDGSATFAGDILLPIGGPVAGDFGVAIAKNGYVIAKRAAGSTHLSFAAESGDTRTMEILANGQSSFATGKVVLNADGRTDITRQVGTTDPVSFNALVVSNTDNTDTETVGFKVQSDGTTSIGGTLSKEFTQHDGNIILNPAGYITTQSSNGHVNFNVTNGAMLVSPDGLSANAVATIGHDGNATFAGSVNAGADVNAGGNIAASGTAITCGENPNAAGKVGIRMRSMGQLQATANAGGALFQGMQKDVGTTVQFNADGSATFEGNVDIGERGVNGIRISASGILQPSRSQDNVKVFEGQLNGTQTSAIDASGAAAFQRITFGNVPGPDTDPHTLDDYEEGTWTPTVSSGGASFNNKYQVGSYTKIGRTVVASAQIIVEMSAETAANAAVTCNLPFTIQSTDVGVCILRVTGGGDWFGEKKGISSNLQIYPTQKQSSSNLEMGNVNTNFYPASTDVDIKFIFTYQSDV